MDKSKRKEVIGFIDCSCSYRSRLIRAIEFLNLKQEAKTT